MKSSIPKYVIFSITVDRGNLNYFIRTEIQNGIASEPDGTLRYWQGMPWHRVDILPGRNVFSHGYVGLRANGNISLEYLVIKDLTPTETITKLLDNCAITLQAKTIEFDDLEKLTYSLFAENAF